MSIFKESVSLKIGKIYEVNGSSIKVVLENKLDNLSRSIDGCVYSIGQIASIIKIHHGRKIIFGIVKMLRMVTESDVDEGTKKSPQDDSRILEADLFGEGIWNEQNKQLKFARGIESYPLPLQHVYLSTNEELDKIYESAEKADNNSSSPLIPIGTYVGSSNAVCKANINKLFGNHCAILGSTGAGKSATVAAIIHSVLDYTYETDKRLTPRIVLIDPHGEYSKAFSERAIIYRAYSEAAHGGNGAVDLRLPYWLMSSDELRSMIIGKTDHEATSQNNIVYEALTYARMLNRGIVRSLGDDPNGEAIPDLQPDKTENDRMNFDRDKPIPFTLTDFILHIDKVQGRKKGEKNQKTQSDETRKSIESILRKIRVLRSNPQLGFVMDEYSVEASPSLNSVIQQFVGAVPGHEDKYLRIIDISGLPNEISGPLTALITRLVFQYKIWQTPEERKNDPVLFVCEEAHRYVPNDGEALYKEAQASIRRIAKEGRKYGIGLMLVSQRPSDVEATVLSQCNSWIVLRLTNSRDQEHVGRFLPDNLSGLTRILSSLTRREAIFVGEAAPLPSRIKVRELREDQLPDSGDISFVEGWKKSSFDDAEIGQITTRWLSE